MVNIQIFSQATVELMADRIFLLDNSHYSQGTKRKQENTAVLVG